MHINPLRPAWTAAEIAIFDARVLVGAKNHQIADELGKTVGAIRSRKQRSTPSYYRRRAEAAVRRMREQFTPTNDAAPVPPVYVLHERNVRCQIRPASLAAALMGDPRPGYTARDTRLRHLSVQDAIEICATIDGDDDAAILSACRIYETTPGVVFEILSGEWFDRLLPNNRNFDPEL